MMEAKNYLKYIVDEIHTVIVATVDSEGLPVTAAIDMMDADDSSLYFLTAKGKNLYDRLSDRRFLAFTAMKGEDTMSRVAVSVRGKVRELGYEKTLTVFQIYEGTGEWFDLSKKPIERANFSFGAKKDEMKGYFITDDCIGCGKCVEVCPQDCINQETIPYVIENKHCLHCGNCLTVCPVGAVDRV